jgi:hypothetical protein
VAERKPFLLRLDPETHAAMQHWADSELRSLNAQIEFVLRRALQERGLLKVPAAPAPASQATEAGERT